MWIFTFSLSIAEEIIFIPACVLGTFAKNQTLIAMQVYFWVLCFIQEG